jgi:DNA-binding response OmpR family regulator
MRAGDRHGGQPAAHYRLGRVLVAGDQQTWGSAVHQWLEDAGYEGEVGEVERVLVDFERLLPDLVVIAADPALPHTLVVCRWIRSRSTVPLVVISQTPRFDPVDVLASGADVVLRPTVGERELVARVRVLLRRRPARVAPAQDALAFGGLVLDPERRLVRLSGGTMPLEGRELELLQALLRDAPKLISRHALRAELREQDAVLDRRVRRLRGRLEAVEGWRRIVTVRGVGFRLLERPAGEATAATTVIQLPAAPAPATPAGGDQLATVTLDLTDRVDASAT